MKRFLLSLLLVSIVVQAPQASATSSKKFVRPITWENGGKLTVLAFLGSADKVRINPFSQPVDVRVCSDSECLIYNAVSGNAWEGYSNHVWRAIGIDLQTQHKDRPITAQVPLDFINGNSGWTEPSDPVVVSSSFDPFAMYRQQLSQPPIEIVYSALNPTEMTRVDLCVNYRETFTVTTNYGATYFGLDTSRYKSIRSELFEDGRLKKSTNFPVQDSLYGNVGYIPGCATGTLGSHLMTSIDGLLPGKNYTLVYTLTDENQVDATATLDFVTPGACPSGEIILAPSPKTFHFGLLDNNGILFSYLSSHWYGTDLPSRLAPIYHSGSKVIPFNGNLYAVRDSAEKWTFLRDVEEWALVLDDATPQSSSNILAHTVFSECKSAQVRTELILDESVVAAAEQGCAIIKNQVVPTKPGVCMVDAIVSRKGVAKSSGRATPTSKMNMSYVISSVAKTKKLKNGSVVTLRARATRGDSITLKSLLNPTKGGKVTRFTSRTPAICQVQSSSLRMIKKGKCRYTATIIRKGKSTTFSSTIRVK